MTHTQWRQRRILSISKVDRSSVRERVPLSVAVVVNNHKMMNESESSHVHNNNKKITTQEPARPLPVPRALGMTDFFVMIFFSPKQARRKQKKIEVGTDGRADGRSQRNEFSANTQAQTHPVHSCWAVQSEATITRAWLMWNVPARSWRRKNCFVLVNWADKGNQRASWISKDGRY